MHLHFKMGSLWLICCFSLWECLKSRLSSLSGMIRAQPTTCTIVKRLASQESSEPAFRINVSVSYRGFVDDLHLMLCYWYLDGCKGIGYNVFGRNRCGIENMVGEINMTMALVIKRLTSLLKIGVGIRTGMQVSLQTCIAYTKLST